MTLKEVYSNNLYSSPDCMAVGALVQAGEKGGKRQALRSHKQGRHRRVPAKKE